MMHIGLIGGLSPAATLIYYQRLTEAFRTLGRPLDLTIVNAHVDTLVSNAEAGHAQEQARVFAGLLVRLKAAGAEFGTISSLGGHFCFPEIAAISPLPLVSAITPIDGYFAKQGINTIGILGARQVTGTGMFGQMTDTQILAPDDIDTVHAANLDLALTATCTPEQRLLFVEQGQNMIDRGAEVILLGGSDLGLAFNGIDPGYPVVDGVHIHVDHLVKLATEDA